MKENAFLKKSVLIIRSFSHFKSLQNNPRIHINVYPDYSLLISSPKVPFHYS